ncbi:MAG TPA: prepilin-type N-terminal cleavage/methylation domain-containing protein [Planctomycetota bacterium]|nr:prepilin-type N-terminal cleavage/methylation domain-containing protein [Planctomycetota bacterium]
MYPDQPQPQQRFARAFTLVELLVVLVVMGLLLVMAVPVFSRLNRASSLQQATTIVISAMWEARSMAQRDRVLVGVLFGCDRTIAPAPVEGPQFRLPARGQIEIWEMRTVSSNGLTPHCPETNNAHVPDWYPCRFPIRKLTTHPYVLPEGIRVVAGNASSWWDNGWKYGFKHDTYKKDPVGVWRRQVIPYTRHGSHCGFYGNVVIFDEYTGNCVVITGGNWWTGTQRPKVLCRSLDQINGQPLINKFDLGRLLDSWGGDR